LWCARGARNPSFGVGGLSGIRETTLLLRPRLVGAGITDETGATPTATRSQERGITMIQLESDELIFTFPEVHREARLEIEFQRTLRIPDDGRDYPLPPGLGNFPLAHVDDHAEGVPPTWLTQGGVMLPMYQSEAMWLNFSPHLVRDHAAQYPFAVKVATGKVCAVSGEAWTSELLRIPRQNYLAIPEQPWLDGYCVDEGLIRQFVAMPLGAGYTAEEQVTGEAEHGGLQILVAPMKREIFERRFPKIQRMRVESSLARHSSMPTACAAPQEMGLAPGGRMRQKVYEDPFNLDDYDLTNTSRCFVHIANSMVWRTITGSPPPTVPPTADDYTRHGLPWFDLFDETVPALDGAPTLNGLKSVKEMGSKKGDQPLPENTPVDSSAIKRILKRLKRDRVREGSF
jgi:hypothetical protein